jgi:serine/threonine protein kinase
MHHQNVIELVGVFADFDVCSAESSTFGLVLDYCPHGSLHHVLFNTQQTLCVDRKVSIGTGVAAGLAHIHGMSLLHRDLNTANVLLGQDFTPRIADFGCSVRVC